MRKIFRIVLILGVVWVLLIGITLLVNDSFSQSPLYFCCNNNWPQYSWGPSYIVSLSCDGEEQPPIQANVCARYWSAYGAPDPDPDELCAALPDPPLPALPVPANFSLTQTSDYHLRIT